jgi:hypothetical protein
MNATPSAPSPAPVTHLTPGLTARRLLPRRLTRMLDARSPAERPRGRRAVILGDEERPARRAKEEPG